MMARNTEMWCREYDEEERLRANSEQRVKNNKREGVCARNKYMRLNQNV